MQGLFYQPLKTLAPADQPDEEANWEFLLYKLARAFVQVCAKGGGRRDKSWYIAIVVRGLCSSELYCRGALSPMLKQWSL